MRIHPCLLSSRLESGWKGNRRQRAKKPLLPTKWEVSGKRPYLSPMGVVHLQRWMLICYHSGLSRNLKIRSSSTTMLRLGSRHNIFEITVVLCQEGRSPPGECHAYDRVWQLNHLTRDEYCPKTLFGISSNASPRTCQVGWFSTYLSSMCYLS